MMTISGILAQMLVLRLGKNIRPGLRISELELPTWPVLAFALAALAAVIGPDSVAVVGIGAALIPGFGFFFVGLGVLHALLRGHPLMLTALYISLVLSWPALIVTALGLVEQWVDLRRRFASPN